MHFSNSVIIIPHRYYDKRQPVTKQVTGRSDYILLASVPDEPIYPKL